MYRTIDLSYVCCVKNLKPFPIIPNLGGVINTGDIVGREGLAAKYWEILRKRGIALFAERRFGKSSVIRKMTENEPQEFISVYRQVESKVTNEEYVEIIFTAAEETELISKANISSVGEIWNKISEATPEIMGVKLGKLTHNWQKKWVFLIGKILERHPDKIFVLFLDEFSIMLDKMVIEDAVSLIGFLRELVHNYFTNRLRFVYTGSVGIDLVFNKIERKGYNLGDPLNHMDKQELPPFTIEQSVFFCKCLELGCKIKLDDKIMEQLHNETDGIPYFMEHIVDLVKTNRIEIPEAINLILNNTKDNSSLKYFYDRISKHYPEPEVSEEILNILSKSEEKIEDTIIEQVLQSVTTTKAIVKVEIDRLYRDGYFKRSIQNEKRVYSFRYKIIKTWWKINKA